MCNNDEFQLKSFNAIIRHMYQEHHDDDYNRFVCLINADCGSFDHIDDLKNHYATDHSEIVT